MIVRRTRGVTQLVMVFVPLPQARYDNAAQARFYSQLAERLRDNPITARSALSFPTPFEQQSKK